MAASAPSPRNLRVCMIGCGGFARLCHGPAQRRIAAGDPAVTLAACADPDPDRARAYAAAFGYARSYADPAAMLDAERPDAVILAVPPPVTGAAAGAVLARGLPVLLEKPPGLDTAELDRLVAAADAGRAPAQVAFNRRYMPILRQAASVLAAHFPPRDTSRLDYEMVRCNRWNEDFSTTAIHAIDAALLLARGPLRTAALQFQTVTAESRTAVNVRLSGEAGSGTAVSVTIQPVTGRNAESAALHAAGRSLLIRIPASPLVDEPGTLEFWRDGERIQSGPDTARDASERFGVLAETEAFLAAVRAGTPPTPSLRDCRQQVALMEAIRRGRSGPVDLPAP